MLPPGPAAAAGSNPLMGGFVGAPPPVGGAELNPLQLPFQAALGVPAPVVGLVPTPAVTAAKPVASEAGGETNGAGDNTDSAG